MNEQIKVRLKDGKIQVEAIGFAGSTCEDATRFLESALGTPADRQHKPEYYEIEEQHQHLSH